MLPILSVTCVHYPQYIVVVILIVALLDAVGIQLQKQVAASLHTRDVPSIEHLHLLSHGDVKAGLQLEPR
jgi:hypothetical protein